MRMVKQICFLLALFLLFSSLFVGCREAEEYIPDGDSEMGVDSPAEESNVTESEVAESEMIETEGEDLGNGWVPHPFSNLGNFYGTVVRWGTVVEEAYSPPKLQPDWYVDKNVELLSELVRVNIEILDGIEYAAESVAELDVVFVSKDALKYIIEGEVSLVFLFVYWIGLSEENKPVEVWIIYPGIAGEPPPIFRYEDGRMIIDESQTVKQDYNGAYRMWFLRVADHANRDLKKHGIDEKYHFRNGMTLEELGQFYDAVQSLPMPERTCSPIEYT